MSSLDEERMAFKRAEGQRAREFMGEMAGMVSREEYAALAAERDRLRKENEQWRAMLEDLFGIVMSASVNPYEARTALAPGTPVDVE